MSRERKEPPESVVTAATERLTTAIGRTDLPLPQAGNTLPVGLAKYADILTATVEWIKQQTQATP